MDLVDDLSIYDELQTDLGELESLNENDLSSDTCGSDDNSSSSSYNLLLDNTSTSLRKRSRKATSKTERVKVSHAYTDFSLVDDELFSLEHPRVTKRGGVVTPFPERLHSMLETIEDDNLSHAVSWLCHGRAFLVHKPAEFVKKVLPVYFRQSKITSFQRQLNLYGFRRITHGPDNGAYYHCLFLRGRPKLLNGMIRVKIKGTGTKAANNPEQEPNFYKMPPVDPLRKHHRLDGKYLRPGIITTFVTKAENGMNYQHNIFRPSPLRVSSIEKSEQSRFSRPPHIISLQHLRSAFEPIDTNRAKRKFDKVTKSSVSTQATHPLDQFSFALMDFSYENPGVAV